MNRAFILFSQLLKIKLCFAKGINENMIKDIGQFRPRAFGAGTACDSVGNTGGFCVQGIDR